MSKNINLVLKEAEGSKQKKKIKIFRLIAVGSLLLVSLISLLIYLANSSLTFSLEDDKDALLSQLTPLREKEAKLKVINDRLNNISFVQGERTDVYKIVNTLLGEVPIGATVDNLEFIEGEIVIKVSFYSLSLIDELINNLIDMGERKEIVGVLILNSLDVSKATGTYQVSINIGLI